MSSPYSASTTHTVYAIDIGNPRAQAINALLSGTAWGAWTLTDATITISYSFPWTSNSTAIFSGYNNKPYSSENQNTASQTYGLNTSQITAAKLALQAWANVANISFSERNQYSSR